jgi:hypothetical protein
LLRYSAAAHADPNGLAIYSVAVDGRRRHMRGVTLFVCLLVSIVSSTVSAQQRQMLRYAVVFSDSHDMTHFRDEELPWQVSQASADPLHPYLLTPYLDAKQIGFLRLPVGSSADWHPAPGKRFVMVLRGLMEVEVGDGERRRFGSGSVALVTDVNGRGHRTSVVGNEEVFIVWVPVP